MTSIPQVAATLHAILTTTADLAGRQTGFVQRASPITGSVFVQTLVFGLLANPQASLSELTQTAAALGVTISAQALDQRFTETASLCLEQVLTAALRCVVTSDPLATPLLARFNGVYLQDSTTIVLPPAFAERWTGCGGSTPEGDAALKLQVQLNLSDGRLLSQLQEGRDSDRNSTLDEALPRGALRITDLGYWELARMKTLDAAGCFWLARAHAQTALQTSDGRWWSLVDLLTATTTATLDLSVRLGKQVQLPARLLAQRVPQEVADQRRRRLRATACEKGCTVSALALALAEWTVFVTNLPPDLLSLDEALVLGRMRWQIELLFKLWKSHGEVDVVRDVSYWRQTCELYAKLLARLVEHWVLVMSCWQNVDRSLTKAAATLRRHAIGLAEVLRVPTRLSEKLETIARCIAAGCRINRRRKYPTAFQLLLNVAGEVLA
jgi:hypothetical protein